MNSNTIYVCCTVCGNSFNFQFVFLSLQKTLKGKNFNSEKFFVNMLANFLMLLKLVAAKVAFFSSRHKTKVSSASHDTIQEKKTSNNYFLIFKKFSKINWLVLSLFMMKMSDIMKLYFLKKTKAILIIQLIPRGHNNINIIVFNNKQKLNSLSFNFQQLFKC